MWPIINRLEDGLGPFGEWSRLDRELDWLFDREGSRATYPAMNVWGNAEQVRVEAELSGIDPAALELTVTGNTLTLEGDRPEEALSDKDVRYRRERPAGRFLRTVQLPFEVDDSATTAYYEHGVLKMVLPRSEATKPRKITIKTQSE
jgi:HSP20 family protein